MEKEQLYSIGIAARKAGMSPHTIRKWEQRYKTIRPERTASNRRLYSLKDISRLAMLRFLTDGGHHIGTIAHLNEESLRELLPENYNSDHLMKNDTAMLPSELSSQYHFNQCFSAATGQDTRLLDTCLKRADLLLDRDKLITEVIMPLLHAIGRMWLSGELRIAEEHLVSSIIRTFLGNIITTTTVSPAAPVFAVTTPSGSLHEFGTLAAAASAVSEGWSVVILGPNLPAEEIADAIKRHKASVLGLSIVYPPNDSGIDNELAVLKKNLPEGVVILAGGRSADSYNDTIAAIDAEIIHDFELFRRKLTRLFKPAVTAKPVL